MPEVNAEIDAKRAAVKAELDETLKERAEGERALKEAENQVRRCQASLQAVLEKEGKLRYMMGELDKARTVLKDSPD